MTSRRKTAAMNRALAALLTLLVLCLSACGGQSDGSDNPGPAAEATEESPRTYSYTTQIEAGAVRLGTTVELRAHVDAPVGADQVFWRLLAAPAGSRHEPHWGALLATPLTSIHDAEIDGDTVYLAARQQGLAIGSLTGDGVEVLSLTPMGIPYITNDVADLTLVRTDGTLAVAADHRSGLFLLDIHNPYQPQVLDYFFADISDYNALEFRDGIVYAGDRRRGLLVLQVEDERLVERAVRPLPRILSATALGGGLLAAAVGDEGVLLFDVGDPLDPLLLGTTPAYLDAASAVSLAGEKMAVGYLYGSLCVYDIGDPSRMVTVAESRGAGSYFEIDFDGSNLYGADPVEGTFSHYVLGDTELLLLDRTTAAGAPRALARHGGQLYLFGKPASGDPAGAYAAGRLPEVSTGTSFHFTPDVPGAYLIEAHGASRAWNFPGRLELRVD